jgi:periplasmic divalent cation tolerance protein
MDEVVILYTTWPDAEAALACGRALTREGLAACVNVLPGMRSVYRWQGAVAEGHEAVMLIKTARAQAETVRDQVAAAIGYDVPMILTLPADTELSHPSSIAWIVTEAVGAG